MQTTARTTANGASQLKRLAKAARIVQSGKMVQVGANWVITSETGHTHAVNGVCDCADYQFNTKLCKHKLAAKLAEKVAQGKQTFSELLKVGVRNIVKENPASVSSANGVNEMKQIVKDSTTPAVNGQMYATGCEHFHAGCGCIACTEADASRWAAINATCATCNDALDAHNAAQDGLCWRCAQERDYNRRPGRIRSLSARIGLTTPRPGALA